MQSYSKADVRYWQSRLFKEKRQGHVDADYSVRIAHVGRRERFQLRTANKYDASVKARTIYQVLVVTGWTATLNRFKKEKAPQKVDATIGEFLREIHALHASKARTIENYAYCLRMIAAWIAGFAPVLPSDAPGKRRRRVEQVDALKLSILTPSAIQKWREAFLAARAASDPIKQRSARVSVNTYLKRSRSLFRPEYLEGLDSICLPDPPPFSMIKFEKRSMPRYQSTFDVLELIRAAGNELAESKPEQFKVFVLALMAGLRKGEIDKLEWRRFNWAEGTVSVTPTELFQPKSDNSVRSIWIPAQVLEIFRSYRSRATSQFVIESSDRATTGGMYGSYSLYRCKKTFRSLLLWLRAKGVEGGKPLHSLRKEFGSLIAKQFGIYAAKECLGHSNIATTAEHYLEPRGKPMIELGHLLPLPAPDQEGF